MAVSLPLEVLNAPRDDGPEAAPPCWSLPTGLLDDTKDAPWVTASGARVPAFLRGYESPQSMRGAGFQTAEAYARFAALARTGVAGEPARVAVHQREPLSPVPSAESSPQPSPREKREKRKRREAPPKRPDEVTVLVRNLPRDLVPQAVLQALGPHRAGLDFLYVPVEFQTKDNLGYAFLNFTHQAAADGLRAALPALFGPAAYMQPARVQGKDANVKRFRNSSVMGVLEPDCKPMLFERGAQVPFPEPTKKLPPVGPRFRCEDISLKRGA